MILNVHQFIVLLGAGFPILDWGYMSCTRPPYFFYIARAFAVLEGIGLSHSLGNCQAGQCSNMFQLPPAAILAQATISSYSVVNECLLAAQLGECVFVSLVCGRTTISYVVFWVFNLDRFWLEYETNASFALDIEDKPRTHCEFGVPMWSSGQWLSTFSTEAHMSPSVWSAMQILASAMWDAQKSQDF